MIILDTEVSEVIIRAPGVKSFRFKLKQNVGFKPGQFFFVTIKTNGNGAEETKHFSFSNSPTEKGYVEFTKRITESSYSKALDKLQHGDFARLKMPSGAFTFTGEYERIAFLSGGIGITPIRSICKYATDIKLSSDIILLYGNNKEEDIIFKADFDEMARLNANLHPHYTLTAKNLDISKWPGLTGYIDDKMIKEQIPDFKDRVFYICGPAIMVTTLVNILKEKLQVQDSNIKTENFFGY